MFSNRSGFRADAVRSGFGVQAAIGASRDQQQPGVGRRRWRLEQGRQLLTAAV